MSKLTDEYSSANQSHNSKLGAAKTHDRKLIENSFHSGIASKAKVKEFFNKYGTKE